MSFGRGLGRGVVCAATAAALAYSRTEATRSEGVSAAKSGQRQQTLAKALAFLRAEEAEMRLRWERDELGWRKLPARAWPAYQPTVEEIPKIASMLCAGGCSTDVNGLLPVVLPDGKMYSASSQPYQVRRRPRASSILCCQLPCTCGDKKKTRLFLSDPYLKTTGNRLHAESVRPGGCPSVS